MECAISINNHSCLVKLSGQFVFSDHAQFKEILNSAEEASVQHVTVNLAKVEFIDSAGLGMLLLLRDTCDKHKKRLTLKDPQGQVKKVFHISKFEHLFTIEP